MSRSVSRTLIAICAAVAVGGAAVALAVTSGGGAASDPDGDAGGSATTGSLGAITLASFDSCATLLEYYRTNAAKQVTAYGLGGSPYGPLVSRAAVAESGADSAGSGATGSPTPALPAQAGSDGAGTGTNVQVAGVDEGDLAKVVAGRLYSVTDGVLRITDLGDGTPRVLGELKLDGWYADQMLLTEDRLLLIGSAASPLPASDTVGGSGAESADRLLPTNWMNTARVAQVDVSNPNSPKLTAAVDIDGSVVGARLVDGVVRLGISSAAGRLPFVYPGNDTDAARALALKTNRGLVASSTIDTWLPRIVQRPVTGNRIGTGGSPQPLVACADVSAPNEFSGLDTLTMMTVDLAGGGLRSRDGGASWDSGAVVASGGTMYATAEHTYIATTPWFGWLPALSLESATGNSATDSAESPKQVTQIHLFATANDSPPAYLASGEVPGSLMGQYAMDEHDGMLRVASTTEAIGGVVPMEDDVVPGLPTPGRTQVSSSSVTVLAREGSALVVRGSVGGLGKTEQIRSVRFLGDVGYVVTFRQTDPLYTIDLSKPAKPRVAGELKILGYSAYLHPAGDGRLLGIGQDATQEGRTKGLQMSLFDVSDPASPRRIDQVALTQAWSAVEGDPHAFTLVDGLALAPFESWAEVTVSGTEPGASGGGANPVQARQRHDAGVVAVRVRTDSLTEANLLRPVADGPVVVDPASDTSKSLVLSTAPMRTFVVDGVVYSLATEGVAAHDARSFKRLTFTRF